MKELELYPVYYDGKIWQEEDCGDVFVSCYHDRVSLNAMMGVYVGEGIWVYPDDTMDEW